MLVKRDSAHHPSMPKLNLEIRLMAGGRDAATAILFISMAAVAIYGTGERMVEALAALVLVGFAFALSGRFWRAR